MNIDATFRGKLAEAKSFDDLQTWLDEFCESSGMRCWHNYGPADLSAYLSQEVRILLFGAESWGYNNKRIHRGTYLEWLEDGNAMPCYAGVLIALLREFIECGRSQRPVPAFEKAVLCTYYRDRRLLKRNLEYTIYANARISSKYPADGTSEEVAQIASEARLFAPYRRRFVEVMRPQIILCGGRSARGAVFVEDGPFPPSSLQSQPVFTVDQTLIVCTRHLSNPRRFGGYRHLYDSARTAAEAYIANRNTRTEDAGLKR